MDLVIAAIVILIAYLVFKSLVAVLIALAVVALAIYIVRALGVYPRRRG